MDVGSRRALSAAQALGNLGEGQILVEPQHHRGALVRRQLQAQPPGRVGVGDSGRRIDLPVGDEGFQIPTATRRRSLRQRLIDAFTMLRRTYASAVSVRESSSHRG